MILFWSMPTNYNWLIATEKRIVWLSELHKLFHFSHFFSNILSKIPKIFVSRSVFSTKNCPLSSYFCSSIVTVRIISSHSFSNFSGCFYSQQICSSFIFVLICLWVISFSSSRCQRERKNKRFFLFRFLFVFWSISKTHPLLSTSLKGKITFDLVMIQKKIIMILEIVISTHIF